MPVNPGNRWPQPTRTQQVATLVRTNAIVVTFVLGELAGMVTAGFWLVVLGGH